MTRKETLTVSDHMRVAVVSEGADLGCPMGWQHWHKENGEWKPGRFEANYDYVPPPPPTERERSEQRIAELEEELASERVYLAEMEDA